MAWCSLSVSPQNASSPNVSNRKVWRPSSRMVDAFDFTWSGGGALLLLLQAPTNTATANARQMGATRCASMADLPFVLKESPARWTSHLHLDESLAQAFGHGFDAIGDLQLLVDVLQVGAHGGARQ